MIEPPVGEAVQQHARHRHLERPFGNREQAELLRDDLALLRDLDVPIHRLGRQGREGAMDRRPPATAHASSTSVEQPKLHA